MKKGKVTSVVLASTEGNSLFERLLAKPIRVEVTINDEIYHGKISHIDLTGGKSHFFATVSLPYNFSFLRVIVRYNGQIDSPTWLP